MTARVLVLSLTTAVEDRLLPELVAAGTVIASRAAVAPEAAEALQRGPVDLLLASASARHLTDDLVRAAQRAGVPLVVLADGPAELEHAGGLGLHRVLAPDAPLETMLDLADRPVESAVAAEVVPPIAGRGRGRVTAVWGPVGAPGRTTTAIALAAELAATGARVALVDADTVGASVAPALGLFDEAPGFAAACRLAGAGALTEGELDRVAQHHRAARGGFAVLTGIGRSARWPELSTDRVTKVLDACRDWADHTVVDAGFNLEADEEIVSDLFAPRRNAATIASVRAADRVLAVGAADPVGLARLVRHYGDLVETTDSPEVTVVVTKVRGSAVGLNPGGQIRSTLLRFAGIEDPVLVPHDQQGCDAALLTARSLPDAAPRSAATAALRRLVAERLVDRPAPERRRARLLGLQLPA